MSKKFRIGQMVCMRNPAGDFVFGRVTGFGSDREIYIDSVLFIANHTNSIWPKKMSFWHDLDDPEQDNLTGVDRHTLRVLEKIEAMK